jgi:hypothetical protein
MNRAEVLKVMIYLFADSDKEIKPEKLDVWADQFGHLDYGIGMAAAQLLLMRKTFGSPKVYDFAEAVAEVTATANDILTWGEAWTLVMNAVSRFGAYRAADAVKTFPVNVDSAIGSEMGFRELCKSNEDTLPTQRAQFRQRYEALIARQHQTRLLSPKLQKTIAANRGGNTRELLDGILDSVEVSSEH